MMAQIIRTLELAALTSVVYATTNMFACTWDFEKNPAGEVKKELCDSIDKWKKESDKDLKKYKGQARAKRLHDITETYDKLTSNKISAYAAYVACNGDDWEKYIDLIKKILDAASSAKGLLSANTANPLGPDGAVAVAVTTTTDGPGTYVLDADSTITWTLGPSPSTVSTLSGTIQTSSLSLNPETQAWVGTATACDLTLDASGSSPVALSLHAGCAANRVEVVEQVDGTYSGSLTVALDYDSEDLGDGIVIVSLPIDLDSSFGGLASSTGGSLIPAEAIFPERVSMDGDDTIYDFVLRGPLKLGATTQLRIGGGTPGDSFTLYRSMVLAYPLTSYRGHDDWWLDTAAQTVYATGTFNADGEASVGVTVPMDMSLVGTLWAFQAIAGSGAGERVSSITGQIIQPRMISVFDPDAFRIRTASPEGR